MNRDEGVIRTFVAAITRNGVSLVGAALTTASAVLFISLFAIEWFGFQGGPYLGILSFVVIPALFVAGLALIPIGRIIHRRKTRHARLRGEPEPGLPVLDLNVPRVRRMVLIFVGATIVNLLILSVATYKSVEVMDSTEFCGTACHSVMAPEYSTYQRSPHARVDCVSCHIGPGADWFVKAKLSGSWQLVSVNLKLYPRPIPTPIHNLRPARDTCEQCHWPTKFVGDRLRVLTHFQDDEANTETKTVLLLRVGGVQGRASQGIHWHVDPAVRIRYRSDQKRETIGDIELTGADGVRRVFKKPAPEADGNAGPAGESEWRTMDCVDCHNRPSHIYRLPEREMDRVLAEGQIDRGLPFIRREGLRLLKAEYASHDEARARVAEGLAAFYETSYPTTSRASIETAARTLGTIYSENVFPEMKISWGAYPSHLGHMDSPGCFRCHDGEHVDEGGKTISADCDTCHTLLAMDEPDPEVLKTLKP